MVRSEPLLFTYNLQYSYPSNSSQNQTPIKYTLIFLFLITSSVHAQESTSPFPLDSAGEILYSGSGYVTDATQNELYNRAKLWVTTAYNSPKDVIQLDDKEGGTIIVKGIVQTVLQCGAAAAANEYYTLKIEMKDGKYRYSLSDVTFGTEEYASTYKTMREKITMCKKGYEKMFADVASQNNKLIVSLEAAMKKEGDKW